MTDLFASDRDGYTLNSLTFNFDLINTNSPDVPTGQFGVIVKGYCPHNELFGAFIPVSKQAFIDQPDAFAEMMGLVDLVATQVMEDGCHKHDKKGK